MLTVLCPSARVYARRGCTAKMRLDPARQAVRQVARWLRGRPVVVVADSGFAAIALLGTVCEHATVARTATARCRPLRPATGGLEHALAVSAIAVAVVNPSQVREFARASGQFAKTDCTGARVLARFASAMRPDVRALPDAEQRAMEALVGRRRQVSDMLTAERNRLHRADEALRASIEAHIAFLDGQRRQGDGAISATLVADLPEFGRLSGRQIASLVGVAPHACESSRMRGARTTWGGRLSVRSVLCMSAPVVMASQRGAAGLLCISSRAWQGAEGGARGGDAQADRDAQRDGASGSLLGAESEPRPLTRKTGATDVRCRDVRGRRWVATVVRRLARRARHRPARAALAAA